MEKKYLNEFVGLFDKFSFAVGIVARECGCICAPDPTYLEKEINKLDALVDDLIRCRQMCREHKDWNILYNFLNEIETNLYTDSINRVIYLKSIIRKFKDITPYTNMNEIYCIEDATLGLCSQKSGNLLYNYLLYIHQFFKGKTGVYKAVQDINDIHTINVVHVLMERPDKVDSISKRYLYECGLSIDFFAVKLDNICREFEIDFIRLQDDLGIYLQRYRGYNSNEDYNYFELPETQNQSLPTETSSSLTIGELTAEQTKDLFELANGVVFEKTRIEDFAESLNSPERNKLQLKNKTLAAGFFSFWDSYFGSDNNKDAIISALDYIKAYKKNGAELNVSKKQVNFINQVKKIVCPNNPNLSERK